MKRPDKQLVDVTFYKPSGKWYASGHAFVSHFLFEDGFIQDLIDTQTELVDGWQRDGFYLAVSAPKHVEGFYNALFKPSELESFNKSEEVR